MAGLLCGLVLAVLAARPALAHPMGNFSINRYSRVEPKPDAVTLLYIVDMAEIPTHAERAAIDADGDGQITPAEQDRYLADAVTRLGSNLTMAVDGRPVVLTAVDRRLTFPPGQAGLPTLRLEIDFTAALPVQQASHALDFVDANYADRLGWQEIIVAPGPQVRLLASNVPQQDISQALRQYPVNLLQDPPTVHTAQIRWQAAPTARPQASTMRTAPRDLAAVPLNRSGDGLAGLIALPELGPWTVLLALLAAFGWGAVHALSPGHGKTLVAAYLVGARGTLAHAAFLGATTTVTHTLGVFALGLATLVASEYILPERLYPWLSTLSGLLVIALGLSIGWSRLRTLRRSGVHPGHHHHTHAHGHDHHHHDHHHHDHHHDGAHRHDHPHGHDHGHSHLPPDTDGRAISWRSLLALGISGGLLPCPSALVVLLAAVALGRIAFGLVLILAFSLGLASVLTAIGLLLIHAGKLFERLPESGRYARYLAVASAVVITVIGAGITLRALIDTGLLRAWV
jgi:ABC-type nickel/cobalt efflux system permease component RcnA